MARNAPPRIGLRRDTRDDGGGYQQGFWWYQPFSGDWCVSVGVTGDGSIVWNAGVAAGLQSGYLQTVPGAAYARHAVRCYTVSPRVSCNFFVCVVVSAFVWPCAFAGWPLFLSSSSSLRWACTVSIIYLPCAVCFLPLFLSGEATSFVTSR